MNKATRGLLVAVFLLSAVLNVQPAAWGAEPATPAQDNGIEPEAMASLMRMATFLSGAQRFSVTVDVGYDVVQPWGQKIEFGSVRKVTIRRPDRIRVDVVDRDGARSGVRFDGRAITVFNVGEKVYAIAPRPGTLDGAMEYFVEQLQMRLPGREVFSGDLPRRLKERVKSARIVGTETLRNVPTQHLALRTDEVDVQVWVHKDGSPLLRRLVITYRRVLGQPEFRADFNEWNLSARAPDALFEFTPSPGSERIPFVPRKASSGSNLPTGGAR